MVTWQVVRGANHGQVCSDGGMWQKNDKTRQSRAGWSRLEQAGRVLEIIIIVTELTLHSGQHCLFDKLSRSEQHNYQSFIYLHSRERKTNSEKKFLEMFEFVLIIQFIPSSPASNELWTMLKWIWPFPRLNHYKGTVSWRLLTFWIIHK